MLDVGAGTGFVSLPLAAAGYRVTAMDLSAGMLAQLTDKAAARGLPVTTVTGDAAHPPDGEFDAVIERHLLWTLPDPGAALAAWRRAAPDGRLVLLESAWGGAVDPLDVVRSRAGRMLRTFRGIRSHHHAEYSAAMCSAMPLGAGTTPERLVELVEASGWAPVGLHRLRDVEWATGLSMPTVERLLGVTPRFAVTGGQRLSAPPPATS